MLQYIKQKKKQPAGSVKTTGWEFQPSVAKSNLLADLPPGQADMSRNEPTGKRERGCDVIWLATGAEPLFGGAAPAPSKMDKNAVSTMFHFCYSYFSRRAR